MWHTDTLWFDVAVVLFIFAAGNIMFGRFEEHKPRWKRLLKFALISAAVPALSATAGRAWSFGLIAVLLFVAAWVHGYWLPKHGVNGWTAEPRDRYLELIRARR